MSEVCCDARKQRRSSRGCSRASCSPGKYVYCSKNNCRTKMRRARHSRPCLLPWRRFRRRGNCYGCNNMSIGAPAAMRSVHAFHHVCVSDILVPIKLMQHEVSDTMISSVNGCAASAVPSSISCIFFSSAFMHKAPRNHTSMSSSARNAHDDEHITTHTHTHKQHSSKWHLVDANNGEGGR